MLAEDRDGAHRLVARIRFAEWAGDREEDRLPDLPVLAAARGARQARAVRSQPVLNRLPLLRGFPEHVLPPAGRARPAVEGVKTPTGRAVRAGNQPAVPTGPLVPPYPLGGKPVLTRPRAAALARSGDASTASTGDKTRPDGRGRALRAIKADQPPQSRRFCAEILAREWAFASVWLEEIESDARWADREAQDAVKAAAGGDWRQAFAHASQACAIESGYDTPRRWQRLKRVIEKVAP